MGSSALRWTSAAAACAAAVGGGASALDLSPPVPPTRPCAFASGRWTDLGAVASAKRAASGGGEFEGATPPTADPTASTTMRSIIDDGEGHINAELARGIWEWENDHLLNRTDGGAGGGEEERFPAAKLKFSTRAGLRMVDELARELMASSSSASSASASGASATDDALSPPPSSSSSSSSSSPPVSYSDLTQEGTIALMRAMASFDPNETERPDFESYARRKISRSMSRCLADVSRPLRLPSRVHDSLRSARRVASRLRSKLDREPTMEEVAAGVGLSPDRLRFLTIVGRNAVPVESTVEIYDPDAYGPDGPAEYRDEDTYESMTGKGEALLHSGEEEYAEEEEGWVEPHDKVVAPLRDFIPDRATPRPDDTALGDAMRSDLDDLLRRTLDGRELAVIRMRFGISADGGEGDDNHPVYREGMTFTEIGQHMGISRQRAAQIENRALEKLRDTQTSVFVEQYLDDDHSAEVSL